MLSNPWTYNVKVEYNIYVLSYPHLSSRLFLQVVQTVLPQGAPQR